MSVNQYSSTGNALSAPRQLLSASSASYSSASWVPTPPEGGRVLEIHQSSPQCCIIKDTQTGVALYTIRTIFKLVLGGSRMTTNITRHASSDGHDDIEVAVIDRFDLPLKHDTITFLYGDPPRKDKYSIRKWLRQANATRAAPAQFIYRGNQYTWDLEPADGDRRHLSLTSSQTLDPLATLHLSQRVIIDGKSTMIPGQIMFASSGPETEEHLMDAMVISGLMVSQNVRSDQRDKATRWNAVAWMAVAPGRGGDPNW